MPAVCEEVMLRWMQGQSGSDPCPVTPAPSAASGGVLGAEGAPRDGFIE